MVCKTLDTTVPYVARIRAHARLDVVLEDPVAELSGTEKSPPVDHHVRAPIPRWPARRRILSESPVPRPWPGILGRGIVRGTGSWSRQGQLWVQQTLRRRSGPGQVQPGSLLLQVALQVSIEVPVSLEILLQVAIPLKLSLQDATGAERV